MYVGSYECWWHLHSLVTVPSMCAVLLILKQYKRVVLLLNRIWTSGLPSIRTLDETLAKACLPITFCLRTPKNNLPHIHSTHTYCCLDIYSIRVFQSNWNGIVGNGTSYMCLQSIHLWCETIKVSRLSISYCFQVLFWVRRLISDNTTTDYCWRIFVLLWWILNLTAVM